MGGLLLTCAVVDYFTFYNYPIQRSIIMARTERSAIENERLLEISEYHAKENLFKEFYKAENKSKMGFSVSFFSVLTIPEMQIVLLGGALRHVANLFNFALVGVTSSPTTS